MKHLKELQNIYSEHPALYNTGAGLILSYIIKPFFPHISFLLFFLLFSGVCCIIFGLLLHFEKHDKKAVRITAFLLRLTALFLIGVFILSMIFVQVRIIRSMKNYDGRCDYVLVLGGAITNGKPTKAVAYRMDRLAKYLEKYPDTQVILCGGKTKGDELSEAEAMKNYAAEQGIDTQNFFLEESSTDTTENINYAIEIIKEQQGSINECDIGVITNGYHIYRSVLIMKKGGIENAYGLVAENPGYIIYNLHCHLREYFSVILEYLNL